jgi:hypothetical protein
MQCQSYNYYIYRTIFKPEFLKMSKKWLYYVKYLDTFMELPKKFDKFDHTSHEYAKR